MAKHYVTFGQSHVHRVNGKTLDCDTVACFEAENANEGRQQAFEYFEAKFCFEYHDKEFPIEDLHYFPKGIVEIDN